MSWIFWRCSRTRLRGNSKCCWISRLAETQQFEHSPTAPSPRSSPHWTCTFILIQYPRLCCFCWPCGRPRWTISAPSSIGTDASWFTRCGGCWILISDWGLRAVLSSWTGMMTYSCICGVRLLMRAGLLAVMAGLFILCARIDSNG